MYKLEPRPSIDEAGPVIAPIFFSIIVKFLLDFWCLVELFSNDPLLMPLELFGMVGAVFHSHLSAF